eukprot:gene1457-2079_t
MTRGFVQADGGIYHPEVVRVGAETANLSPQVQAVSVTHKEAGLPSTMLTEQYRMHPAIRQFPSAFFYHGRLTDSESVTSRAPAAAEDQYTDRAPLFPYVLFDVAAGRETRVGGGGSMQNPMEADLAVSLCREILRRVDVPSDRPSMLPKEDAAAIRIDTIDSFQGQECDVVVMSCVRTAGNGAIGFLSDIRRMNVGLTRARKALWVLGNVSALRGNPAWAALIEASTAFWMPLARFEEVAEVPQATALRHAALWKAHACNCTCDDKGAQVGAQRVEQ